MNVLATVIRRLNCSAKSVRKLKVKTFCVLTVSFASLCFLVLFLFFHFYIFEAQINVVYVDDERDMMKMENELGLVSVVFSGWEYFNNFNDSKLHIMKTSSRMEDPGLNRGYWIFRHQSQGSGGQEEASIQLNNFQLPYPKQVILAFRFYVQGDARIDMTFTGVAVTAASDEWSDVSGKEETLIIQYPDEEEKDHAFCTKIIQTPFDGFVDKVVIKVSTFTPSSFVAIDKIVMTIGRRYQSLQMMYTLMPDQWCKTVKTKVSKESATYSSKRRRRRRAS